jgi:hypothetical protein
MAIDSPDFGQVPFADEVAKQGICVPPARRGCDAYSILQAFLTLARLLGQP